MRLNIKPIPKAPRKVNDLHVAFQMKEKVQVLECVTENQACPGKAAGGAFLADQKHSKSCLFF